MEAIIINEFVKKYELLFLDENEIIEFKRKNLKQLNTANRSLEEILNKNISLHINNLITYKKYDIISNYLENSNNKLNTLSMFFKLIDENNVFDLSCYLSTKKYIDDSLAHYISEERLELFKISNKIKTDNFLSFIDVYADVNSFEIVEEQKSSVTLSTAENMYLKEISKFPLLTKEEENVLFKKYLSGDKKAKEKIINHNLKLVVSVAKRWQGNGLDLLDLIQEGNIGLMEVIDKFNPELGYKFSTYAVFYITKRVRKAVYTKSRTINLTYGAYYKMNNLFKVQANLRREFQREPTIEELASEMNVDKRVIENMLLKARDTVSYNNIQLLSNNKVKDYEVYIKDETFNTEKQAIEKVLIDDIMEYIDTKLSKKEQDIMYLRFHDELTLEELAKKYDVTREAIRLTINRIIKDIRSNKSIDYKKQIKLNFQSRLSQFCDEKDSKKFTPKSAFPKFSDDLSMSNWFYENKDYIISCDDITSNSIRVQYYAYFNNHNKVLEKSINRVEKDILQDDTFYSEFKGYSKEDVKKAINKLNFCQKRALYTVYGDELDNTPIKSKNKISQSRLELCNIAKKRLMIILKTSNNCIKKEDPETIYLRLYELLNNDVYKDIYNTKNSYKIVLVKLYYPDITNSNLAKLINTDIQEVEYVLEKLEQDIKDSEFVIIRKQLDKYVSVDEVFEYVKKYGSK